MRHRLYSVFVWGLMTVTGCTGNVDNEIHAVVEPSELSISTNSMSEPVIARFTIRNTGRNPFTIKKLATSCGCTKATFDTDRVLPGKSSEITATITPINVGTNRIQIEALTDIDHQQSISMSVNLTGTGAVPYVANSSNIVAFGNATRAGASTAFFYQTKERKGTNPWLHTPRAESDGIMIHGGMKSEKDMGSQIVAREYEYEATLSKSHKDGEFSSKLIFPEDMSPKMPDRDIIRIHGFVVPAIQVTPSAIFGTFPNFEKVPEYVITFRNSHDSNIMDIEPLGVDPKRYSIEKISDSTSLATFRLRFPEKFGKELTDELVFRTDVAEMPEIRLPVRLRIRD